MNVYLRIEDDLELIGHTGLPDAEGEDYVVDIAMVGTGAALRLTYALQSVPVLTPELKLGLERAVVLSLGQTPDFLPDWQRLPPEQD